MVEKIKKLKQEKNAIILSHYYTSQEVQEISDYVGDSFYLAKIAREVKEDVIVFCGVSFMGESAKILNPTKKVLMPDLSADCPMAHMVTKNKIQEMKQKYDDLAVVCYVNSIIDLKCQSDICVTSSNAVEIVKRLPNKNIFFIPDNNLGNYVKKHVKEKNVIVNDGFCPIHKNITKASIIEEKAKHPSALILSHPECNEEILKMSDYIGSTLEIINYVKKDQKLEYIICTEQGILYELQVNNPNKKFYFPNPCPTCINMKKNTLEKIVKVLETEENEVQIENKKIQKALMPLQRMLDIMK